MDKWEGNEAKLSIAQCYIGPADIRALSRYTNSCQPTRLPTDITYTKLKKKHEPQLNKCKLIFFNIFSNS